jgi:signal transduction histidine kinase
MQAQAAQRLESEQRLTAELRRLTDRLATAREEEQARIARDLHDDLGQLVTALTLTLRSGERLAAELPPGPAPTVLVEVNRTARELAGQVLAAIQRIARDLNPRTLQGLDVETALRRELRRLEQNLGFQGAMRVDGNLQGLPNRVAAALFRIGQEALTNVARHAEADRVDVALRVEDGVAVLEVADDGRGIDPDSAPSLGLIGMRERAASLGGDLAVRPGPKRGTVLAARIPLAAPPEGEGT